MHRFITIYKTLYILVLILLLLEPVECLNKRSYTTGIADLVRLAFRRTINRFLFGQTSYDSEVFRYSQHGSGGLYSGESCRLSAVICSHDEQCCSGRCMCRRWSTMGEERCIRKCL